MPSREGVQRQRGSGPRAAGTLNRWTRWEVEGRPRTEEEKQENAVGQAKRRGHQKGKDLASVLLKLTERKTVKQQHGGCRVLKEQFNKAVTNISSTKRGHTMAASGEYKMQELFSSGRGHGTRD